MNNAALLQSMFQRAVQAFNGGNLEMAAAECERMLGIDRRNAAALHILGSVAFRRGDHARAADLLAKVVKQDPGRIQAVITLGEAQLALARFSDAAANFRKVAATRPDDPVQHYNLGLALRGLGRLDEAAAALERCRDLDPSVPGPWNILGDILRVQGRLDEAVACFEQALRLAPDYSPARANLGITRQAQGRTLEAISVLEQAIMLKPDDPDLHYNLGCSLQEDDRTEQAVASYRRAIALRPDYGAAHWNLSHSLLRKGQFTEGWAEYEWRWKLTQKADVYPRPLWTGDEAGGRTILLWEEQGFGDTIQFIRFAPALVELGWKVVVLVQKPLKMLLSGLSGVEVLARGEALPSFDVHCSLMSLPRLLGTGLDTIPARIPYLEAQPERVRAWRERLPTEGLRVGIVWQGNPNAQIDSGRSIPLARLAPLAALPGVHLISLQKHDGLEQLADLPQGMTVQTLDDDFDAGPGAFLDSAAVMANLDLILTTDTAMAHLAGAMGRATWVMLRAVSEWRWLEERSDSPWYPTVRLFRQPRPGDWDSVIAQVADGLSRLK